MNAGFRNPAPRGAGFLTIIALLLLLLGAISSPAQTLAAESEMPKLGIEPANSDAIFFSETVEAGKSETLTVEVSNAGKNDVQVLTYAADVYSLVNGGLGVNLSDAPVSGPTTWLDYQSQTINLPHGEGRQIEFELQVPEGTPPGEYVTSLVIQNAFPIEGEGAVAVNQILRQAIAVAIRVPGEEHPSLEIGPVTYKDGALIDSLLIEVRNTGNLHLKPTGTVRVVSPSGSTPLDVEVAMDSVYAGTSTMLEIGLGMPFDAGTYQVSVDLADSNRGGSASLANAPLNVVATSDAAAVQISDLQVVAAGSGTAIQFADVTVALDNAGVPVPSATVILHVERDGTLVEDYALSTNAAIEPGVSELRARYLPLSGWQAGSYTFSIRIESTDPATGQTVVLASSAEPVTLDVR
jgi:hypothetical protein